MPSLGSGAQYDKEKALQEVFEVGPPQLASLIGREGVTKRHSALSGTLIYSTTIPVVHCMHFVSMP